MANKYNIERSPFRGQDIIGAGPGLGNGISYVDLEESWEDFVKAVQSASNSPEPDISNQETLDAIALYTSDVNYKWKMDLMYQAWIITVSNTN